MSSPARNALISVTRLHLRSWRYLPAFIWYTTRARRQAVRFDGNRLVMTRKTAGLAFWTLTAWDDQPAMLRYRNSGPHAAAMPKLKIWCDEASYAHWEQPADEPVTWPAAEQRLAAQGKRSHVRNPSPTHQDGQTAPGIAHR